jgi:hypothetical protein
MIPASPVMPSVIPARFSNCPACGLTVFFHLRRNVRTDPRWCPSFVLMRSHRRAGGADMFFVLDAGARDEHITSVSG